MKLAIIGAGFIGKIIAEQAREMNVETHCFAWEKGAVAKDEVDYFYPISVTDQEAILRECKKIGINGIVAAASVAIVAAAYVAQEMGLNGNPLSVAEMIGDKVRNRFLTSSIEGLSTVGYKRIASIEDIGTMSYPLIIKPVNAGGKVGLSVVKDRAALDAAFAYAVESGSQEFIVEEYIEGGKEYSVESLSYHGRHYILQVTDKVSGGPPHCVELSHHQPAMLTAQMREAVETVISKILTAVGIENGPCHTEIKIVDGKIYLIEVNGRLAGGHISHPLVELSTGYPYIKGVINVALNQLEEINTKEFKKDFSSVFFVTEQTRYLKPIFDTCEQYEWCVKKLEASKELIFMKKNDGYRINHFIYHSEKEPPFFK